MSYLVKPNYIMTPYFERVPKISRCLVLSSQTTKLHLILRGSHKFQASCLVKPNYKTTPHFASLSKMWRIVLCCQAKLQNYTLFLEGANNLKARRLVFSSQTTKLHFILRGCPKFLDDFSSNFGARLQIMWSCVVVLDETRRLAFKFFVPSRNKV